MRRCAIVAHPCFSYAEACRCDVATVPSDCDECAELSQPKRQCMLMDFACDESSWPNFKHVDQVPPLKEYIGKPEDKKIYLESVLSNSCITANVFLMYDALLILYE